MSSCTNIPTACNASSPRLKDAAVLERDPPLSPVPNDDVVEDLDPEELPARSQAARERHVLAAGLRLSRWMIVKENEAGRFVSQRRAKHFAWVHRGSGETTHGDLERTDNAVPDIEEQDAKVLDTVVVARAKGADGPYRRAGVAQLWAVFHAHGRLAHEGDAVGGDISRPLGPGALVLRLLLAARHHGLAPFLGGGWVVPPRKGRGARGHSGERDRRRRRRPNRGD